MKWWPFSRKPRKRTEIIVCPVRGMPVIQDDTDVVIITGPWYADLLDVADMLCDTGAWHMADANIGLFGTGDPVTLFRIRPPLEPEHLAALRTPGVLRT